MADGKTHERYYNSLGWPLVFLSIGLVLFLGRLSVNSIILSVFILLNYKLADFIDPDADQLIQVQGDWELYQESKRFGCLGGFVGMLIIGYWQGYSAIIAQIGGHRSFWSHSLVFGTLGRMVYHNVPYLILFSLFYLFSSYFWGWSIDVFIFQFYFDFWLGLYFLGQFIAWSIGDSIHLLLDTNWAKGILYTPTEYQQKYNQTQKKEKKNEPITRKKFSSNVASGRRKHGKKDTKRKYRSCSRILSKKISKYRKVRSRKF